MEGFRKKITFNFTNFIIFLPIKNPWKITLKTDWWEESDTVLQIYFRLTTELVWEKKKTKKTIFPFVCVYIVFASLHNNHSKGIEQGFPCGCEGSAIPAFNCFQDWSFERIFEQTQEKSWSKNVHPSRERNTMETMTDLDSDLEYLTFFYVSASLSSRVSYSGITRNFFNNTSVVFEHL